MGWLFRAANVERPLMDRANVKDLAQHSFYRWLEKTWLLHLWARFLLTWVSGDFSPVVDLGPVLHCASVFGGMKKGAYTY
jgi:hypothetical protein